MVNVKNKWFGNCAICKEPDKSLSTTKTTTGTSMNYTIIKSCDNCQSIIQDQINVILRAIWRKEKK